MFYVGQIVVETNTNTVLQVLATTGDTITRYHAVNPTTSALIVRHLEPHQIIRTES